MLRFSIPFIPTHRFAEAVTTRRTAIWSLFAALGDPPGLDARLTLNRWDTDQLVDTLGTITGIRVHALINGRAIHPDRYLDKRALGACCHTLERLMTHAGVSGLVFADLYFLSALGAASPVLASQLEAIPSVNFMLDSAPKVMTVLAAIDRTPFRRPGHLILDRSLNRDTAALGQVAAAVRSRSPKMAIGLLANEGCLYQCPFKGAHDALIAMAQQAPAGDVLYRVNRDLGCLAHLSRHPADILKSPFIRPEDVDGYAPMVDFIKLCGRTLGEAFILRTLDAYRLRRFEGNLLDLLDTTSALRDRLHIANQSLPENFLEAATGCDKDCGCCRFCDGAFAQAGRRLPVVLKPLEQIEVPAFQPAGSQIHGFQDR